MLDLYVAGFPFKCCANYNQFSRKSAKEKVISGTFSSTTVKYCKYYEMSASTYRTGDANFPFFYIFSSNAFSANEYNTISSNVTIMVYIYF